MKKLICVLLSILLLLGFTACGNKGAMNTDYTFEKPEAYESVILITINPQFRLYLDSSNNVIAVEAVNDDAKSIIDDISVQTGNMDAVMESLITAVDKGGFVKDSETTEVKIEVVEVQNENVNTEVVLSEAKDTADAGFEKIEVQANITTSVAEDVTVEAVTQTETVSESATQEETSAAVQTTKKPTHTHSFSNATCTEPKKCSCGATEGSALGHNYQNGKCTRCSATDPNYVPAYTSVSQKNGTWKAGVLGSDKCYYRISLIVYGSTKQCGAEIGDPFSELPEDMQEEVRNSSDYAVINGTEFYFGKGDGEGLTSFSESNNTVTLTDGSGNKLVLNRTGENTLVVKECNAKFASTVKIPVGTVFTFAS